MHINSSVVGGKKSNLQSGSSIPNVDHFGNILLNGILQIDGLTVGRTFWHFICQAELEKEKGERKRNTPAF